jgi:hypothetical protein
MSYIFNFVVEILLILVYDLCLVDQTMYNFPLYVMWVVGLEVQVPVWVGFQYTFVVSSGPCFVTETSKNGRVSLASTSIVNLMVGLMQLRWWRNCHNLAGPCGHTTKLSLMCLSHLAGLWSAVSSAISSKAGGKRPLGRPSHKWGDSVKMDLREIRWGGMEWIHVAQDRDSGRLLLTL